MNVTVRAGGRGIKESQTFCWRCISIGTNGVYPFGGCGPQVRRMACFSSCHSLSLSEKILDKSYPCYALPLSLSILLALTVSTRRKISLNVCIGGPTLSFHNESAMRISNIFDWQLEKKMKSRTKPLLLPFFSLGLFVTWKLVSSKSS